MECEFNAFRHFQGTAVMIVKSRAFVASAIIFGLFVAIVMADDPLPKDGEPKTFSELYPVAAKKLQFKLLGHLEAVENAKKYLRDSIAVDDQKAIKDAKKVLAESRSKLRSFRDRPFSVVDTKNGVAGDIGTLYKATVFRDLLISADSPCALCKVFTPSSRGANVKITSLTKKEIAGSQFIEFDSDCLFLIIGTTTVNTVYEAGQRLDETKCLELQRLGAVKEIFTDSQSKQIESALDASEDGKLTDDQQKQADRSRKFNTDMAAAKDAETKLKTAKSYLETAKTLIAKQQSATAKKWLEKAIAISPDSESAKESKKILGSLK